MGLKLFLVGTSWVQTFFSGLIRGSKISSRGYFVSPKHFLVATSWVHTFFWWVFRGSKFFSCGYLVANFVNQGFSFAGCMRKSDRKQKYINKSHTSHSIPNRFQQLSVLFTIERYFIY